MYLGWIKMTSLPCGQPSEATHASSIIVSWSDSDDRGRKWGKEWRKGEEDGCCHHLFFGQVAVCGEVVGWQHRHSFFCRGGKSKNSGQLFVWWSRGVDGNWRGGEWLLVFLSSWVRGEDVGCYCCLATAFLGCGAGVGRERYCSPLSNKQEDYTLQGCCHLFHGRDPYHLTDWSSVLFQGRSFNTGFPQSWGHKVGLSSTLTDQTSLLLLYTKDSDTRSCWIWRCSFWSICILHWSAWSKEWASMLQPPQGSPELD